VRVALFSVIALALFWLIAVIAVLLLSDYDR
jgi:hypothetical protein